MLGHAVLYDSRPIAHLAEVPMHVPNHRLATGPELGGTAAFGAGWRRGRNTSEPYYSVFW